MRTLGMHGSMEDTFRCDIERVGFLSLVIWSHASWFGVGFYTPLLYFVFLVVSTNDVDVRRCLD